MLKNKLNVLVWGGSATENIIIEKIINSPLLNKLFLSCTSDSFSHLGTILSSNIRELIDDINKNKIDIILIRHTDVLEAGITDVIKKYTKAKVVAPTKFWTQLESSKLFGKNFILRNKINTPKFKIIDNTQKINEILQNSSFPIVIKADGLCSGLGVHIAHTKEDAIKKINNFLEGEFEERSKKVIIEEFIEGSEISLMSMWDGNTLKSFLPIKDYKRLNEHNKGVNTGGMGSICPVYLTEFQKKIVKKYEKQLEKALKKEKVNYKGIIYSGIILTEKQLYILEYNVRLGCTETNTLLTHLESDFLDILYKISNKKVSKIKLKYKKGISSTVVLAINGYPFDKRTDDNVEITELNLKNDVKCYKGVMKKKNDKLIAAYGSILFFSKNDIKNPIPDIYKEIENTIQTLKIKKPIYRKDIGE